MTGRWRYVLAALVLAGCSNPPRTDVVDVHDAAQDVTTEAGDIGMASPMDVIDVPDVGTDTGPDIEDTPDTGVDVQCALACTGGPNATGACRDGHCVLVCTTGFGDCNGMASDGCEVDLSTSPTHCGSCSTACASSEVCTAGACGACPSGQTGCSGSCVDVQSDTANCGTCGNECPMAPNTAIACMAGTCTSMCAMGFEDCDMSATNGCEVDTRSDPMHCGSCAMSCAAPSGTASCVSGMCGLACPAGIGDCDGLGATGCETDTTSDPNHCGSCATSCPARTNATATCIGSSCGYRCDAGFEDCDGDPANGCEADLATDPTNCGACGMTCASPGSHSVPSCVGGSCGITCTDPTNFGTCNGIDGDGCESNLNSDAANCNACGHDCNAGGGARQDCFLRSCCVVGAANTTCPTAQTVNIGASSTTTLVGKVPYGMGDPQYAERWYRLRFTYPNPINARITISPSSGSSRFRFDVRAGSCSTPPALRCDEPALSATGATGLTSFDIIDRAIPTPGEDTRMYTPPSDIYVRVYTTQTNQDCADYTLTIRN